MKAIQLVTVIIWETTRAMQREQVTTSAVPWSALQPEESWDLQFNILSGN